MSMCVCCEFVRVRESVNGCERMRVCVVKLVGRVDC